MCPARGVVDGGVETVEDQNIIPDDLSFPTLGIVLCNGAPAGDKSICPRGKLGSTVLAMVEALLLRR